VEPDYGVSKGGERPHWLKENFIMRSMLVRVFDLLFVVAWIGFIIIIVWLFTSLLSSISEKSLLPNLLPDTGKRILLVMAVLWIGLFIVALVFSYREDRFDQFRNRVWRRILLVHFIMLTGPTAYYKARMRISFASSCLE
jgi:hypothetical protein